MWSQPREMISAYFKIPISFLPGSGIRAEVLHPRQETPSPLSQPTTTNSSKIFPCRVGQFTQHSEKRGKSQSGILAGSIKNGIMNLTIFMFYLSVSVYLFLSSQISYKFPDREGDNSLGLAKTIILDFWDFVTSEYYILVPVKKNAYWLKYCIAVLWLDIWKVLSQKEVSFLPFHSRFYHPTLRIDFLNFCNKLVNINWKLKPL